MFCPACKHAMIVVEYHRIELDYCPNCQGVWFDSGELELWLKSTGREDERRFLSEMLNGPEADIAEQKRRCPICRQTLKKVAVSKEPEAHIDACPRGNGIWFDGGEVDVLLKEMDGKTGIQVPVTAFLSEVFQARKQAA
ncbi:MAG: zf-TFIIB domain-containing protein [Dehalococcoidales bacterium]|nr:zf-TFIIB domain-containing protein [Dehalococcoidales bacterium]